MICYTAKISAQSNSLLVHWLDITLIQPVSCFISQLLQPVLNSVNAFVGNLRADLDLINYPFELSLRVYNAIEESDIVSTAAFMRRRLPLDPKDRASAEELLSDLWFVGVA